MIVVNRQHVFEIHSLWSHYGISRRNLIAERKVAHRVSRQEGQRQGDDRGQRQSPPKLFCQNLPVATNKKGTTHITSFISLETIYKMVNILLQPRTNTVKKHTLNVKLTRFSTIALYISKLVRICSIWSSMSARYMVVFILMNPTTLVCAASSGSRAVQRSLSYLRRP